MQAFKIKSLNLCMRLTIRFYSFCLLFVLNIIISREKNEIKLHSDSEYVCELVLASIVNGKKIAAA